MNLITLKSLDSHPLAAIFAKLTEAQLRQSIESEYGLFIAESPKVIKVAFETGYRPMALLCERKHILGDAAEIISMCKDIPVLTGERELLTAITGYKLTRVWA